jgi:hypothetical protein
MGKERCAGPEYMPRPQKPLRPTPSSLDPDIEARAYSRFKRQEFLKKRIRSDLKSSSIDLSPEEISCIVDAIPEDDAFSIKAFHLRLVQCLRGFAAIEGWAKIIPWTQTDAAHVKQLTDLANALEPLCSKLSESTKYLLDHIGPFSRTFTFDLMTFAHTFRELMVFVDKYAPLPDEGRPRSDIKARFLAFELIELWQLSTGEQPKGSVKRRTGGSVVSEFGRMSELVLELMLAKGLISKHEVSRLQSSILSRLDRSKPSRLL